MSLNVRVIEYGERQFASRNAAGLVEHDLGCDKVLDGKSERLVDRDGFVIASPVLLVADDLTELSLGPILQTFFAILTAPQDNSKIVALNLLHWP